MMYIYIHVLFVSNGGKINSKVVYIYMIYVKIMFFKRGKS